jgi:hypothetical protein
MILDAPEQPLEVDVLGVDLVHEDHAVEPALARRLEHAATC